MHVDLFANPSAALADLLLPAASCWERAALVRPGHRTTETANWAQFREGVIQPLHESRSEIEIIFDLVARLRLGEHFFDGDLEAAAYTHEPRAVGAHRGAASEAPPWVCGPYDTRYQKRRDRCDDRPAARLPHTHAEGGASMHELRPRRSRRPAVYLEREPARGDADMPPSFAGAHVLSSRAVL